MIAKVSYVKSLSRALSYGENEKKGGEVVDTNGAFLEHNAQQKAAFWESISNDYRKKAVHFVLAFGLKDTADLRALPEEKRLEMEQKIVRAFIQEMSKRGNNIDGCPYVCYHHNNTDSEHVHLYVLMTTWEGKRLKTKLIGQNATRAAARVSVEWQMKDETYAMKRERRKMEQEQAKKPKRARTRQYSKAEEDAAVFANAEKDLKDLDELSFRARSIEEAKIRKAKYGSIVSEAAKASHDKETFIAKLKEDGVEFYKDEKGRFSIRFTDDGGKERHYTFAQLGLSEDIVPYMADPVTPKVDETEVVKTAKVLQTGGHRHSRARTTKPAPRRGGSGSIATRAVTEAGGSGDENREYEVGNQEGYEQSIANESRLTR